MGQRINIAMAFNRKYMKFAGVTLKSLFVNNPDEEFHVYVLHRELVEEDYAYLEKIKGTDCGAVFHILKIDEEQFPEELPVTKAWSKEMYFRLMLVELLPEDVDRILYLDADVIANQPVLEFYQTDFEDKKLVVCKDFDCVGDERKAIMFHDHYAAGYQYFNSGVMLWNIESLRGMVGISDYMQIAKEWNYDLAAPDQDLLNYRHWNEVKYADREIYNLLAEGAEERGITYEWAEKKAVLIHFVGLKPWASGLHPKYEKIWWKYAEMTPGYMELLCEFRKNNTSPGVVEDKVRELLELIDKLSGTIREGNEVNSQLKQMIEQLLTARQEKERAENEPKNEYRHSFE